MDTVEGNTLIKRTDEATKNNESLMGVTEHKTINILLIVGLVFCYILTVTFNALSGNKSIFKNTVGELADKYDQNTSPAGWTFSIWGIIYLFIAIALVFFLFTICCKNQLGYIYVNPVIVSPVYCLVYGFNFLLNITWLFLWDREQLQAASCDLFAIFFTNLISLSILIRNLEQTDHRLRKDQPKTYWAYIVFASNGQGMYCTWTLLASLLNMNIALIYVNGVTLETAANINLSLVLVIVLGWTVLDLIFLDKFTRYLVTPYLVVVWALGGVLSEQSKKGDIHQSTKTFTKALMAIAISLLLTKIAALIFREFKQPFNNKIEA